MKWVGNAYEESIIPTKCTREHFTILRKSEKQAKGRVGCWIWKKCKHTSFSLRSIPLQKNIHLFELLLKWIFLANLHIKLHKLKLHKFKLSPWRWVKVMSITNGWINQPMTRRTRYANIYVLIWYTDWWKTYHEFNENHIWVFAHVLLDWNVFMQILVIKFKITISNAHVHAPKQMFYEHLLFDFIRFIDLIERLRFSKNHIPAVLVELSNRKEE